MRIRLLKSIALFFFATMSFLAGAVFGHHQGVLAFHMNDAPPKAVLAMGFLRQLERGNLELIKASLNTDIDQGLYLYSLTQDQWWFPLFKAGLWPGGASYEKNTEWVTRVAKYRKQNPGAIPDPGFFDKVPEGKEEYADAYKDLADSHRERLARIKETIEKYSQ